LLTTLAALKWLPLLIKILGSFPFFQRVLRMTGLNHLLDSLTLRAANGAMHKFAFRTGKVGGQHFGGREVEQLLGERGIRVYERTKLGGGELGFSIRRDQAEWAEYLLCRAGVPLTSELLNPEHDELLHPKGKKPKSALERVLGWLEWF